MIRRATDEDIKKIKKGDLFLVDERHDGTIHQYEAAEDARYDGRRWSVTVKAYTMDARTGAYIANAARAFDDCQIVVGDLDAGTINRLSDLLQNLSYLSKSQNNYEDNDNIITWTTLSLFCHYFNTDEMMEDMKWLKEQGYVSYEGSKKGIADLMLHKKTIQYT